MALITEISPADLTGYGREIVELADTDITATLMPPRPVAGAAYTFSVNKRRHQLAKFRAFDAETAIGGGEEAEEKTARLLPVGLKDLITETDHIRRLAADSPETAMDMASRVADTVVNATVDRLRLARAEALVTGKLTLAENRVKQTVDFQRKEEFTATAGTFWNSGGDPIQDLKAWQAAYKAENGVAPRYMIASERIASVLSQHEAIRTYLRSDAGLVGIEEINALLRVHNLPPLTINDATVGPHRLFPEETLLFVSPGVGTTPWGTTAEARDPRYGLGSSELPGLVVGVYGEDDPYGEWVRANAISFPVLEESNLSLAATVIDD